MGRVGILIAACVLSSCASSRIRLTSPGEGGPNWARVDSPNFHVLTDLAGSEAQSIARELELSLDALAQAAFSHPRSAPVTTTVVVFRNEDELHAFLPDLLEGAFYRQLPSDLESEHVILLYGKLTPEVRINLLHELTHDLFARNFGYAPAWLNEGWAQYYSTLRLESGRIHVGSALPHLTFTTGAAPHVARGTNASFVVEVPVDDLPPPSVLTKIGDEEFYRSSRVESPSNDDRVRSGVLYLSAWALVHMLLDGANPYAKRFESFGRNALGAQASAALARTFTGLDFAQFDRDFRLYLARRELGVFDLPWRPNSSAPQISERQLTDDEVHILWARLFSVRTTTKGLWGAELDAAQRAAPTSADVYYYRAVHWLKSRNFQSAQGDLETALRLAPLDARVLLALALSHAAVANDQTAARGLFERLAAVARSSTQFRALARYSLSNGELTRGLEFAQRAIDTDAIDPYSLDVYAQALAAHGRFKEAVTAEQAALAFLPEDTRVPDFFRHLAALQAQSPDHAKQP